MSQTFRGSCHCGKVQFSAEGEIDQVMECNCSHCSRKGFLLWFVPRADFSITRGEDQLTTYTFNRHIIQHQFCVTCGCQAFGLGSMPDGTLVAAINVRCLEGIELADIPRVPVNGRDF
jgi:hypothetical protein